MRTPTAGLLALVLCLSVAPLATAQPAAPAARPDVYHVHFAKAVPGQAAALGKSLSTADPNAPMPGHFIVLRHQEGDEWDYCVIEHLGTKATVDAAPTPPNPARTQRAWHTDTFVSGPPWQDFVRAMGLTPGETDKTIDSVYTVAVWQESPGHREQLEQALAGGPAPGSKIPVSQVLLQHLEGGPWTFLAISRYNSWQGLAADRAAAAAGSADGWFEVRQYSASHRDTIADRIFPK